MNPNKEYRVRRARYAKRPFMGPALQAEVNAGTIIGLLRVLDNGSKDIEAGRVRSSSHSKPDESRPCQCFEKAEVIWKQCCNSWRQLWLALVAAL